MVIETLGAIFSGGAVGLVGSIATRIGDYFTKEQELKKTKIDHEHEIVLRNIDRKMMQLEYEGRNKLAVTEGEMAAEVEAAKAFQVSFSTEPKMYSNQSSLTPNQNWLLVVLDFVRGFIRPGITLYSLIFVTVLYFLGSPDEKATITEHAIFLSSTCTMWWFGIRSKGSSKK